MLLKTGEVWIIEGRKGRLTIKLLEAVDTTDDGFFNAELVEGVPVYLSAGAVPELPGEQISFRTRITHFIRHPHD